jgi:uncharacterized protein (TIGR00730 family)
MKTVCVYCGSASGARSEYADAARALGESIAKREMGLVYGGAHVGLMGIVADSALAAGGRVEGVIPRRLQDRELAHPDLSALHVVETMADRKDKMASLSDAFIALPGGLGTLDELFETMTWTVLGIHDKPSGVLDVGGYWQPLFGMLEKMQSEGFVRRPWRELLSVAENVDALLDQLASSASQSAN